MCTREHTTRDVCKSKQQFHTLELLNWIISESMYSAEFDSFAVNEISGNNCIQFNVHFVHTTKLSRWITFSG